MFVWMCAFTSGRGIVFSMKWFFSLRICCLHNKKIPSSKAVIIIKNDETTCCSLGKTVSNYPQNAVLCIQSHVYILGRVGSKLINNKGCQYKKCQIAAKASYTDFHHSKKDKSKQIVLTFPKFWSIIKTSTSNYFLLE